MSLKQGKHTPPFINREIHFPRHRLTHILRSADTMANTPLCIEAQAGQGKSTLVAQYLNETGAPFVWYQIDPEDNDGISFLKNLYRGLSAGFSNFNSPLLAEMINKNEINPADFPLYTDILSKDLAGYVKGRHYIIFDDLYLIDINSPAAFMIHNLARYTDGALRVILISRSRITQNLPGEIPTESRALLSDSELAMTRNEIAEFLSEMTTIPVSAALVNLLYESTEGWTMGILTQAHSIMSSGRMPGDGNGGKPEWENLASYFKSEVLRHLSEQKVTDLSKLSFLRTVHLELAEKLIGSTEINKSLNDLVRRNYFTRYTGKTKDEIVFHHLFQESLKEFATDQLGSEERYGLYEVAAQWFIDRDEPVKGIELFIRAHNFKAADTIIKEKGIDLYANNAVASLLNILKHIPEETLIQYSWLSLFFGLAFVDQNPPEALNYFKHAEKKFRQENDKTGQLLAVSQLIHFHVWGDSMFSEGEAYLPTAEALFWELSESLPIQIRIHSLYCLTCGYTVFKSDFSQAEKFGDQALLLSTRHGYDNLTAMIRFIYCYINAFSGNLDAFAGELETLSRMAATGRISSHNLLLIYLARLLFLEMKGDFLNFRVMRDHLKKTTEDNLAVKSILLPFIMLWDLDMAIAEGRYETAVELGHKALELPDAGETPHFNSQFLHFKAYADALSGDYPEAKKNAEAAIMERRKAGSPFFTMHTNIIAGGALARAGYQKKAEAILNEALVQSEALGGTKERKALALAHLVSLYSDQNKTDTGKLKELIQIMDANRYHYLLALSPDLFREILHLAWTNKIRRDFVKKLAMERLKISFSEKNEIVPLLTIRTLGRFHFEKEGRIILRAKDFTATQLKLLAMLISSRHGYLNVDDVQAAFWPEKTTAKGRASFDTMISRLRKVLKTAMEPHPVNLYFNLKKEQLSLDHTVTDVDLFLGHAETGLKHSKKAEYWQAENEFRKAFLLFEGTEFLPGISPDQNTHKFREYYLRPLINEASATWSRIMTETPEFIPGDMELLEKIITSDSGNIELVKNLYHLKSRHEGNLSATRLIKTYRETLRVEGFYADEIEEIIEGIWTR